MKKLTSIFGVILFALCYTLTSCGNSEGTTLKKLLTEEAVTEETVTEEVCY